MEDYQIHEFPNGIRLIHRQVMGTKIAHCGFMMDIGSRDERADQVGIAHFWEHMAFKGTKRRKAFHIINRLETVGGDLNAYTTKEKICFHASLLDSHFEKAVDLLTDITFNSTFPDREIGKERSVILEEMAMYEDDPADAIQDEFDLLMFGQHPLGMNILGTRDSVRKFHKSDFDYFIKSNLNTHRLVFASVSALPFKIVKRVLEKYIADIPTYAAEHKRIPFSGYQARSKQVHKSISQSHCMMGNLAYSLYDNHRIPFSMLVNVLGGPGMNSKLNLSIREKHGLAYSIYANYNAFTDVGQFSIQFASEPKVFKRCMNLVHKELDKLKNQPLGKIQLHHAKQQMMGQMAMSEEGNLGFMLMLGKSLLDLGKIESLARIFEQIEAVDTSILMNMANEVFDESQLSYLMYLADE
ncbi:MAG: M16 family metallopeptidase [Flammeovirgaceae bacterium]